jgi:hypothetical protein
MSDSDDNKTSRGKTGVDAMTLSNAESRFFCNIVMNLSSKADIDVSGSRFNPNGE